METEPVADSLRDCRTLQPESLRPVVAEGPTPLFATISGAHLYGFASADSDVDIRGSYVRSLDSVLGLGPHKDTWEISRTQDGLEVDWVAHDVLKFVTLMTKRNGYVLEQLYSPLVVLGGSWHEELLELAGPCIVRQLYFHYRGFFHNQHKMITAGNSSAKAVLYAYRVLLSGIHVLKSGVIEANLPALLDSYPNSDVQELLEIKIQGTEKGGLDDQLLNHHVAQLSRLEEAMEQAFKDSLLPQSVENWNALSDFVVRARKSLGA